VSLFIFIKFPNLLFKTTPDISHGANATRLKSNTYFVVLPNNNKMLPLPMPPPSPKHQHQRPIGAKPPAPAAGTTTTSSGGIILDSLYPSTTTKRYVVSINREKVVPTATAGSSKKG
jgi:hypothetical protein